MPSARSLLEAQFPGLHVIGGPLVRSYLLIDPDGIATLIDSGLLWEPRRVTRDLQQAGLSLSALKTILLTHGHLDHTANLAWYRKHTNAEIIAHPLEQIHIDGEFPYSKANWMCHALESVGRHALRYRTVEVDRHFHANEDLDCWGGLRVLHLPGHTAGHCGFYSEPHDLLFSGDLFACYFRRAALPPAGLNSCPLELPKSLAIVRNLDPRWILPNHTWVLDLNRIKAQTNRLLRELQM